MRAGRPPAGLGAAATLVALLLPAAHGALGEGPNRSATGLAYEVRGGGSPVVFVHGSNLDRRMWEREAARLGGAHRVVLYDLRGHGASETPTEPFSASGDLAGLLDELGIDRTSLVGLSDGARIAIDFALERPRRVERMLLAAPSVGGYRPTEMPAFFDDLIAALLAGDFARANEVLLAALTMRVPEERRELVAEMVRGNEKLWSIPRELQRQLEPPAIGRLEELAMPILVAVGEADLEAVRHQAELIASRAPAARLVTVPGGGHLLNMTSAETFGALLEEFLRPRPPGAPSPSYVSGARGAPAAGARLGGVSGLRILRP